MKPAVWVAIVWLSIAGILAPRAARADEASSPSPARLPRLQGMADTTYGRLEGDVGAALGVGVVLGPRTPRLGVAARLRYLDTIGVFATYEEARAFTPAADPHRVLAFGLEIRPLFFARWVKGYEFGSAFSDLVLDSIGLELGAVVQKPAGEAFGAHPGLQAGLGVELPLSSSASGAWIGLHGGARWSEAALAGEGLTSPSDRALYLAVTLEWHGILAAHLVDRTDRAPDDRD